MRGKNRRARGSRFVFSVALAFAVAVTAAAAVSDKFVTVKTKIALLTTIGVDALEVNVDTIEGRVTLHGTVSSEATLRRTGEVTQEVEGVTEVQNLLQVVARKRQERVEARDEQVAERVAATLRDHGGPGAADVRVVSVNAGVVLLGGSAPNLSAHLGAIVTASRVRGVRRIETEVQAPGELEEDEVYHLEPGTPVPRATDG
jgi:osmotically-inducible protein OsmY